MSFREFSPQLTVYKAGREGWKDLAEERASCHANQRKEKKGVDQDTVYLLRSLAFPVIPMP